MERAGGKNSKKSLRVPLEVENFRTPEGIAIRSVIDPTTGKKQVVIEVPKVFADSGDFRFAVPEIFNGKVANLEMDGLRAVPTDKGTLLTWKTAQATGTGETDVASGKTVTASFGQGDYLLLEEPFGLSVSGIDFRIDSQRQTKNINEITFVAENIDGYSRFLDDAHHINGIFSGKFELLNQEKDIKYRLQKIDLKQSNLEFLIPNSNQQLLSAPEGIVMNIQTIDEETNVPVTLDINLLRADGIDIGKYSAVTNAVASKDLQALSNALKATGGEFKVVVQKRETRTGKHIVTLLADSNGKEATVKAYIVEPSKDKIERNLESLSTQNPVLQALKLDAMARSDSN